MLLRYRKVGSLGLAWEQVMGPPCPIPVPGAFRDIMGHLATGRTSLFHLFYFSALRIIPVFMFCFISLSYYSRIYFIFRLIIPVYILFLGSFRIHPEGDNIQ